MTKEGKFRSLCRVLLLAASMTALSAGAAVAQDPGADLGDLNNRILDNPGDVQLNLAYAHAAEAAGKPRLALAAYERILINDPSNAEARAGYERLRLAIEPSFTATRVEVGVATDSNPLNVRFSFSGIPEDSTVYFARAQMAHEQNFLGMRWRTNLNVDLESYSEISALNYDYVGIQTGPAFAAGPHLAITPAIGVSGSWLGGDSYYTEINASLGLEGRTHDISYWARLRYGQRNYKERDFTFFPPSPISDDGHYTELTAGFAKPHLLTDRDSIVVAPFARWSDMGSIFDFFGGFAPGHYDEYGIDVAYNYQLLDHLQATVGATYRERDFKVSFDDPDKYFSPRASLTWQGLFSRNLDAKLEYSQRDNNSDEYFHAYEAQRVSLSLIARF